MRTGAKVALGSALFGMAVALLYWFLTYDPTGTVLLGTFGIAPLIIWGYVHVHDRPRRPDAMDRADADPADGEGEMVGTFSVLSLWPVILGAGSVVLVLGLVYGVWLIIPGAVVATIGFLGIARE